MHVVLLLASLFFCVSCKYERPTAPRPVLFRMPAPQDSRIRRITVTETVIEVTPEVRLWGSWQGQ